MVGLAGLGMEGTGFEDLLVYRGCVSLADELNEAVAAWASFERWSVGRQGVRAADSVGANIAEACGRSSDPDRRRFLVMARGSAYELQHWIARAEARNFALPSNARARADEIGRMLNGLLASWTHHRSGP